MTIQLDQAFRRELPELGVDWQAAPSPQPTLVALNRALAVELGLDPSWLESAEGVAVLAGNAVPPAAMPIAMAYAGHQFGGYSPRLGDGRALLLGELTDRQGRLVDVHLKGSGRTPFARGGDGKAGLVQMLREFLIAEAMHALGVPTTRALAVVTTGEAILREQGPIPGAVLTRIAASHIRVGTFEYAARIDDPEVITRLADHAIARHHPAAADAPNLYLALLDAVVDAQAALIARWMSVGFIHGVMNTDNTTISGETIDYGPCAFLDRYDPSAVFSSIDHAGRYAFGNQPAIAQWNLARFAESLLGLIHADTEVAVRQATEVLHRFPVRFQRSWERAMATKIGLAEAGPDDASLFEDLLTLMHTTRADYTSTFRALAASLQGEDTALRMALSDGDGLDAWLNRWHARLATQGQDRSRVASSMDEVNPLYIPRNHLVEDALDAAGQGDLGPFERLLAVVTNPFVARGDGDRYAQPAPESFTDSYRTFCGT